jgi:hypothetical protein
LSKNEYSKSKSLMHYDQTIVTNYNRMIEQQKTEHKIGYKSKFVEMPPATKHFGRNNGQKNTSNCWILGRNSIFSRYICDLIKSGFAPFTVSLRFNEQELDTVLSRVLVTCRRGLDW